MQASATHTVLGTWAFLIFIALKLIRISTTLSEDYLNIIPLLEHNQYVLESKAKYTENTEHLIKCAPIKGIRTRFDSVIENAYTLVPIKL